MINTLEQYKEAGIKCAQARNQRDEARANSWHAQYVAMRHMEAPADRAAATEAFDAAYKATRVLPPGALR